MKITFLEGCLEVSNTTLKKIPYFAALLNVNPDLETTHLDFKKNEFLEIIKGLETSLSDYLGLQSFPNLLESIKPLGFIFKDKKIDSFDENDYHLIYSYPAFKIFGDLILKSDKENYTFNIIVHESKLGIVYNGKILAVIPISSMIYINKKLDHLLFVESNGYKKIKFVEEC